MYIKTFWLINESCPLDVKMICDYEANVEADVVDRMRPDCWIKALGRFEHC